MVIKWYAMCVRMACPLRYTGHLMHFACALGVFLVYLVCVQNRYFDDILHKDTYFRGISTRQFSSAYLQTYRKERYNAATGACIKCAFKLREMFVQNSICENAISKLRASYNVLILNEPHVFFVQSLMSGCYNMYLMSRSVYGAWEFRKYSYRKNISKPNMQDKLCEFNLISFSG